MKKRITAVISILLCLSIFAAVFTACKSDGNNGETDAQGEGVTEVTQEPVTVGKTTLVDIVKEALGDEAKNFNGDLSTLTDEQLKKVEALAEKKGFVIENNSGKPVMKDPAHQEASFNEYREVLKDAGVPAADKLSDEDYKKVSQAAKEKGMTAVLDENGKLDIIKPAPTTAKTNKKPLKTGKTRKYGNDTNSDNKNSGNSANTNPAAKPGYVEPMGTTLVRTKLANNTWKSTYSSKDADDILSKSVLTSDNSIVCVGSTFKSADNKILGYPSGLVVKFDENGNKVWSEVIGADETVEFTSVVVLTDGSIIAAGSTFAEKLVSDSEYKCKSTIEGVIVKFDQKGNKQWIKLIGGSGDDLINSAAATPDGGFVLGGKTDSKDGDFKGLVTNEFGSFICKMDAKGNMLWKDGFSCSMYCSVDGVAVTDSGSVYAAIVSYAGDGDFSLIKNITETGGTSVAKYTPDGEMEWITAYSDTGNTELNAITIAKDGGCIIGGYYTTGSDGHSTATFKKITNAGLPGGMDAVAIKVLPNGKTDWISTLGGFGDETITAVTSVPGGYAVCGYSDSSNRDFISNNGKDDGFLYVLSEYGDKQTYALFGGSGIDYVRSMCGNGGTSVYICGSTTSGDGAFADCRDKGTSDLLISFLFKYDLQQG